MFIYFYLFSFYFIFHEEEFNFNIYLNNTSHHQRQFILYFYIDKYAYAFYT